MSLSVLCIMPAVKGGGGRVLISEHSSTQARRDDI